MVKRIYGVCSIRAGAFGGVKTREAQRMGEFSDMIIDGFLCEMCGEMIDGKESGYPRLCDTCKEENE
jgi:hypothetical protein